MMRGKKARAKRQVGGRLTKLLTSPYPNRTPTNQIRARVLIQLDPVYYSIHTKSMDEKITTLPFEWKGIERMGSNRVNETENEYLHQARSASC